MNTEGMYQYTINGAKCYFRGTKKQAEDHVKDTKRKRRKSPHVVDFEDLQPHKKLNHAENAKANTITYGDRHG